MSEFKKAIEAANITITKYDPSKNRPIYVDGAGVAIGKFAELLISKLGGKLKDHPIVLTIMSNTSELIALLETYAEEEGVFAGDDKASEAVPPAELAHLTLNIDRTCKEPGGKRYFCTTKEELVDPGTSGQYYIDLCEGPPNAVLKLARPVIPTYLPRSERGVTVLKDENTGVSHNHFNTYIPPSWKRFQIKHPKEWDKISATPPALIIKYLKFFIPDKKEREYLYAWIYKSLTERSFVYLVLNGAPGSGKNRLKIILSALHGDNNSVDGKKETLGANQSRFNSQMVNNTLIWFDELKYGPEMEPRMKEYQNSRIAVERKGVDATSSTQIYSSMIISNNDPRDNYILFNSRKFAPITLSKKNLNLLMSSEEIEEFSNKVDQSHPEFDVKYVAQIAKWILKIGPKYVSQFPNLEYQGPKFWELAHANMSRWQKIAVHSITTQTRLGMFPGWDPDKKAFLWSQVEEALRRKKEYESKDYRDATTVKAFFDTYRDEQGIKIFETEKVVGSIIQDFWVKPIKVSKIKGVVSLNAESMEIIEEIPIENVTAKARVLSPKADAPRKVRELRPPGMSLFQWNKMQLEKNMSKRGKINVEDQE